MSGAIGVYHLDGAGVDKEELSPMIEACASRGSDGVSVWTDEYVGLAHLMLHTTPESLTEQQPVVCDRGELVLIADARIDNRDELIERLDFQGLPSQEIADSQIILAAYQKWGEDCLQYLVGDFAFAIWHQSQKKLFCARDFFGVKPFYYHYRDGLFAFGSDIKSILARADIHTKINEFRLAEYLLICCSSDTETFYEGIYALAPAHKMVVAPSGMKISKYWELDPNKELVLNSDAEYAEAFKEVFLESVRCRMRSAFPIGSMLSGGLDTSSIVSVAGHLLPETQHSVFHTFSVVFDKISECDERFFQDTVLARGAFQPHYCYADTISPFVDIERINKLLAQPIHTSNTFFEWCLLNEAKNNGVRVVLEGFDGDTTVSHGLGYLTELAESKRWLNLGKEVFYYCRRHGQPWVPPLWSWVVGYGINPLMSKYHPLNQIKSLWSKTSFSRKQLQGEQADNFLDQDFYLRNKQRLEKAQTKRVNIKTERQNHYHKLIEAGFSYNLQYSNSLSTGCNLEIRYPFWDKRLVEFCLSLPGDQKLHKGWSRVVMRRALEGILPPEVQWRGGKAVFTPVLKYCMQKFAREEINDVVNNSENIEDFLNMNHIQQISDKLLDGDANNNEVLSIYGAVGLNYYLQEFAKYL